MKTLKQRCETEEFAFVNKANLLDDFSANPDYNLVKDSILDLANLIAVQKSMLAGTVDMLCGKYNIRRPN